MPVAAERASKQGPSQDGQNKSNDHAVGTTQAPLTGSWVAYLKGLVGGDKKAPNVGDDSAKKTPLSKDPKASTRHGNEVVEPKYTDVGKQVYKDGAALGDVNQGYLANCYLVAAMGAIAMQRPDLVESMIKDNGDGTATVMLYTHDQALAPPGEGKATPVRVSLKMPSTDGKNPVYAKSPTRELWPSLIEKAYVVLYKGGDYQGANTGGSTTEAMSAMLGTPSTDFALASKSDDDLLTTLTGLLKSGKPIAAASLDKEDLKRRYDASRHPDVKSGKRTEEEVLKEFLETFETHHNIMNGTQADGQVTLEEFTEYYTNISASIDNDEYFALMMNNSWNLTGDANTYKKYPKGWGNYSPEQKKNAFVGEPHQGYQ
jgi:hypothetical protein